MNLNNHSNNTYKTYEFRYGNQPQQARPEQHPSPRNRSESAAPVVIRLVLLAAASVMAALFVSFLFVDFTYEYIETPVPSVNTQNMTVPVSETVSESVLPVVLPKNPNLIHPVYYDFSSTVPESEEYPLDYFNDTVFLGDSRTVGMIAYTAIKPHDYSSVGLNVTNSLKKAYIRIAESEELVTMLQALELQKGTYKSVYIALGVNELGYETTGYMRLYKKMIDEIRKVTDVPIYIQLIIPVTTAAANASKYGVTNEKCHEFNAELKKVAEEKKLYCIDPSMLFALEDGSLDPAYTFDGIHLTVAAYEKLVKYYRTHVVDPADYTDPDAKPPVKSGHETPEDYKKAITSEIEQYFKNNTPDSAT